MAFDTFTSRVAGVSPALTILLDREGPTAAPDAGGLGPLGLAELVLLERLAQGVDPTREALDAIVEATGADADRLDEVLAALRSERLLTDRPTAPPGPASPAVPAQDLALEPGEMLVVLTPVALRVTSDGFQLLDHDGMALLTLDARDLAAASALVRPTKVENAFELQARAGGSWALDQLTFTSLLRRLEAAGMARRIAEGENAAADNRKLSEFRRSLDNIRLVGDAVERQLEEYRPRRVAKSVTTGLDRIDVVPVHPPGAGSPLALAMVMAYARDHDGGKLQDRFDFFPRWLMGKNRLDGFTDSPGVFLFSNYLWSTSANLALSAEIKRRSPGSLIVHGGPDTPKYDADTEQYFALNPQVDITVRGEGEATMAGILEALMEVEFHSDRAPDLSPLHGVPGLSFRHGNQVFRTEDRERIPDLDLIPSPYLTGLLDPYAAAQEDTAIIETNRGCPYGCTFCDWGSATLSRIRKFDLDRVFGELEWCARNQIATVLLADANFGIFERDVQIAEKVAELKAEYGYPKECATNYAKNTVKHLKPIVKVMADAGIVTEGLLSLQSMDESTLKTVKRSNIKTEKYDNLAKEFRAANLPLYIDLMLGLPGATVDGFRNDLQQCIDREVNARIFATTLLVNSPMNEPSYRGENQIQTEVSGEFKQRLVVSTASFTRSEYDTMSKLREIYIMCENHGLLRQISRFVHQEKGVREVDLYEMLWRAGLDDRNRWPAMSFMFETGPSFMIPPVSWRLFIDEVHRFLVDELGMADDAVLRTALDVQHALLPSRNRRFPQVLELAHDFGRWHTEMLAAKDDGHWFDWVDVVPTLGELPPAVFPIDDPNEVCVHNIGYHVEGDIFSDWELRSPVSRSTPATHLVT